MVAHSHQVHTIHCSHVHHTHTHTHAHTHTCRNVFPITQVLEESTKELQDTCDHFLSTLADCMELEEHLRDRVVRASILSGL